LRGDRACIGILEAEGLASVDTVKGVFAEQAYLSWPVFDEKTHIQKSVARNQTPASNGVFRVSGVHANRANHDRIRDGSCPPYHRQENRAQLLFGSSSQFWYTYCLEAIRAEKKFSSEFAFAGSRARSSAAYTS